MIGGMRVITAAVVGALCGAGWFYSIIAVSKLPCDSAPLVCSFTVYVYWAPPLVALWGAVAWGLLRLARYSPAWPTVLAGTSIAIALAFVLGLVMVRLLPPWTVHVLIPFSGAAGYALAARATASYRGRVRAEHREQDGTPSA
jgi:hypothetical protein